MAHREFADADGVRWQVWAVLPSSAERREAADRRTGSRPERERRTRQELRVRLGQGLAQGWLVFQCAHEKRRLRPIPDGWADRSDAELAALIHEATPTSQAARRLIE